MKIWRWKEKLKNQFLSGHKCRNYPKSLYFDGKKPFTLHLGGKSKEEKHITILQERLSKYLGHSSPESSKASGITDSIANFFHEKKWCVSRRVWWHQCKYWIQEQCDPKSWIIVELSFTMACIHFTSEWNSFEAFATILWLRKYWPKSNNGILR